MKINKSVLNEMLIISEQAFTGHKERRQLEFRISISYITLLALAIYHQIGNNFTTNGWVISIVSIFLIFLHGLYCYWLYVMHRASNNDVRRRDFYLKKAERIVHYMSKTSELFFTPGDELVYINLGVGCSKKMTESQLFHESEPDIYIHSKKKGTPPPKWYKNIHYLFPVFFATFLEAGLIAVLISKYFLAG